MGKVVIIHVLERVQVLVLPAGHHADQDARVLVVELALEDAAVAAQEAALLAAQEAALLHVLELVLEVA